VRVAADEIRASADPDANVIFGASLSRPAGEEVVITLIATGMAWPKSAAETRPRERKVVEPKIVKPPEPAEPAEPAKEPVESVLPVNGGRRRQPAVASNPRSEAVLDEAHVVDEPQPTRHERSTGTPSDEEIDLEVPSFLRRRRPPDPGEL
jgi:FtsZ family, C-terminal domain